MSGPGAPDRPPALHVIRIHHVGIIVRNAEAASETFQRGLGLDALAVEEYQGISRVAFLQAGDTLVELIEPLRDDSPWAAALRDHGEGAHHVGLEVADIRATIAVLAASGVHLLDAPRRAAGDVLSVFLDPAATGGTLIELVQQIRASSGHPRSGESPPAPPR